MRRERPGGQRRDAARMLAANRIAADLAGSAPNRDVSQKAMNPWMTNPPPNASSANSADSRATIPRDLCSPRRVVGRATPGTVAAAGTSTARESSGNTNAIATPTTA